jgi:hypothetical protein
MNIVAYMLKPRTVEAEKRLGNGLYSRSRVTHDVRCDVARQVKICCKRRSLGVRATLVFTHICGKHISAAVNQLLGAIWRGFHAARIRTELSSGVGSSSRELRGSAVEGDWSEMARKEFDCAKKTSYVLQWEWDCYKSVARIRLVKIEKT